MDMDMSMDMRMMHMDMDMDMDMDMMHMDMCTDMCMWLRRCMAKARRRTERRVEGGSSSPGILFPRDPLPQGSSSPAHATICASLTSAQLGQAQPSVNASGLTRHACWIRSTVRGASTGNGAEVPPSARTALMASRAA